jgi:hypothetical protein
MRPIAGGSPDSVFSLQNMNGISEVTALPEFATHSQQY